MLTKALLPLLPILLLLQETLSVEILPPLKEYYFSLLPQPTGTLQPGISEQSVSSHFYLDSSAIPVPLATYVTVYMSFWVKPTGFFSVYQTANFITVMGKRISHGSPSSPLSQRLVLRPSNNWLNIVLQIQSSPTPTVVKYYIREIDQSETWINPNSKELLYYFTRGAARLTDLPSAFTFAYASQTTLNAADMEVAYLSLLGGGINAISAHFDFNSASPYNLEALDTPEMLDVAYRSIVAGRPKLRINIPTFAKYVQAMEKLGLTDTTQYLGKIYDHGKLGYLMGLDSETLMTKLPFNDEGFSSTASFEFKFEIGPIASGNTFKLKIQLEDLLLNNVISRMSVTVKKYVNDPTLIQVVLYSLNSANTTDNTETQVSSFLVGWEPAYALLNLHYSFVYSEGYGLLHSDSNGTITDRYVTYALTDGDRYFNSTCYKERITRPLFLHSMPSNNLRARFSPSCDGATCTSSNLLPRLIGYQNLIGAIPAFELYPYMVQSATNALLQISYPVMTKDCAMSLASTNYRFPLSAPPGTMDQSKLLCSRMFTQVREGTVSLSSDQYGVRAAVTPSNCLIADTDNTCLLCGSGFLSEFSMGSSCFDLASCTPTSSQVHYAFTTASAPSRTVDICYLKLQGCSYSTVPGTCLLCERYKYFSDPNDKTWCQCVVPGCGVCDHTPCDTCDSGAATVVVDKETSQFQCSALAACNQTIGAFSGWSVPPALAMLTYTPRCMKCLDPFCGDCMANKDTCVTCASGYFMNSTMQCEQCSNNCKECVTTATNCIECTSEMVLTNVLGQGICYPLLVLNNTYYVGALSKLYFKFNHELNPGIRKELLSFKLLQDGLPTMNLEVGSFEVLRSHLVVEITNLGAVEIFKGTIETTISNRQLFNSSKADKFIIETLLTTPNVNYFRLSGSAFEKLIGIFIGIVLGLTGLAGGFISVKYTMMSMKVFQMNNYFYLINVQIPYNLYLFFETIQFGNVFRLFESINPVSFLTNSVCGEFEDKLLALNKQCQLLVNAGPHVFWFALSGIIKLVLEVVLYQKLKAGEPKGKFYEFVRVKMGMKYFIEMINYFHMDLVLYNLMNLFFVDLQGGITYINLLLACILLVFFLYFYIQIFVIISKTSKDFRLLNLCKPGQSIGLESGEEKKPEGLEHKKTTQNEPLGKKIAKFSAADLYVDYNRFKFLFQYNHCINNYSRYYYLAQLIKEFMLATILVLGSSQPLLQTVVFLMVFMYIFIMNLSKAPWSNESNNKFLVGYSFMYLVMSVMFMSLVIFGYDARPKLTYYLFGYLCIVCEIGVISMVVTMTVMEFLNQRKQKAIEDEIKKGKANRDSTNNPQPLEDVNVQPIEGKNEESRKKPKSKRSQVSMQSKSRNLNKESDKSISLGEIMPKKSDKGKKDHQKEIDELNQKLAHVNKRGRGGVILEDSPRLNIAAPGIKMRSKPGLPSPQGAKPPIKLDELVKDIVVESELSQGSDLQKKTVGPKKKVLKKANKGKGIEPSELDDSNMKINPKKQKK